MVYNIAMKPEFRRGIRWRFLPPQIRHDEDRSLSYEVDIVTPDITQKILPQRPPDRFTAGEIENGSVVEAAAAIRLGRVPPIGYAEATQIYRQGADYLLSCYCLEPQELFG